MQHGRPDSDFLLDLRETAKAQTILGFLITMENTVWVGDPASPFAWELSLILMTLEGKKPNVSCRV